MVKIYGAGGFHGMEAYQSGMLISPEGHILTVWSHVLDTDYITVDLGRRPAVRGQAAGGRSAAGSGRVEDRRRRPALLRSAQGGRSSRPAPRVLALSNMFGVATGNEPASVQQGTISVVTRLEARRGVFETPYHGPVYVLDVATNNPGAAGGALVTRRWRLAGMLGKELRNCVEQHLAELRGARSTNCASRWKKSARAGSSPGGAEAEKKPERPLGPGVAGNRAGPRRARTHAALRRHVLPGSPAAKAGIRPDDLILLVGDHLIPSCKALRTELETIDCEDAVRLTLLAARNCSTWCWNRREEAGLVREMTPTMTEQP